MSAAGTGAGRRARSGRPARVGRARRAAVLGAGALLALGAGVLTGPETGQARAADPLPPADLGLLGATGAAPGAGSPPGAPVPPTAPLPAPADPGPSALDPGGTDAVGTAGIPATVLRAYRTGETRLATAAPGCHLSWAVLAGIGKIESDHARGGAVTADGTTRTPILGPVLDGSGGNAALGDTDGGRLDGDPVHDRAVGPMQFIPSTWRTYGADGSGDGSSDPGNVVDAAVGSGRYLCAGGGDLATPSGLHDAVFRYNHSEDYVARVVAWARTYAGAGTATPDAAGPGTAGTTDRRAAGSALLAATAAPRPATVRAVPPVLSPVPGPTTGPAVVAGGAVRLSLPPGLPGGLLVPTPLPPTAAGPGPVLPPGAPAPRPGTPATPPPPPTATTPTATTPTATTPTATTPTATTPTATTPVPTVPAGTTPPAASSSGPATTVAVDPAAVCTQVAPPAEVVRRLAPARVLRVRAERIGDTVRCTAVTPSGDRLVALLTLR